MPITFLKSRNNVAEGFSRTINLASRKRNGQTLIKSILRDSRLTFSKDVLKVKVKSLSRVRLFATPWTVAYQPKDLLIVAKCLQCFSKYSRI